LFIESPARSKKAQTGGGNGWGHTTHGKEFDFFIKEGYPDCSLNHANCSLNHADCSLNHFDYFGRACHIHPTPLPVAKR
jgi:hypothetical protein